MESRYDRSIELQRNAIKRCLAEIKAIQKNVKTEGIKYETTCDKALNQAPHGAGAALQYFVKRQNTLYGIWITKKRRELEYLTKSLSEMNNNLNVLLVAKAHEPPRRQADTASTAEKYEREPGWRYATLARWNSMYNKGGG
jgi:hypothetical protein